jgi:hypothetical protein
VVTINEGDLQGFISSHREKSSNPRFRRELTYTLLNPMSPSTQSLADENKILPKSLPILK